MVLSKKDALLVRSVVFSFLLRDRNEDVKESLQKLLENLDEFLLNSSDDIAHCEECEESSQDDEEDLDEEAESLEVDELLSVEQFVNLPEIDVQSDGKKVSLEFEENDEDESDDSVLALVGDSEAFEVVAVQLLDGKIHLYKMDGSVSEYQYTKLPKRWSKVIQEEKIYGVGEDESEDDE